MAQNSCESCTYYTYDEDYESYMCDINMDEDETSGIELVGEFKATEKALPEHSEAFDMDLKYFINAATFVQRVKVTSAKAKLVGYVEYMSCSGGQCTPPAEADFSFDLTK